MCDLILSSLNIRGLLYVSYTSVKPLTLKKKENILVGYLCNDKNKVKKKVHSVWGALMLGQSSGRGAAHRSGAAEAAVQLYAA